MSLQFAPTSTSKTQTVNWKAVIFWGIVFGLIGYGIYSYREPILAFLSPIPTRISNFQIPDLSGFFNGIMKYVNENPIAVIATSASLCTAGITIISKIRANKEKVLALQEKAQVEQYARETISLAQQQALEYKQKYAEASKNTGLNSLQEALDESQKLVSTKETQIKNLQSQLEALNNIILLKDTKVIEKTVVK